MSKLNTLDKVALLLLILGGISWGMVGFLKFDLVAWLFGGMETVAARTVYALLGIAALYKIFVFKKLGRK